MAHFARLCEDDSLNPDSRVRRAQSFLNTNSLDPRRRDGEGWCPLHYAAKHGRFELVKLLLPLCDPLVEVAKGRYHRSTALHFACANGRRDIVEILLEHYNQGSIMRRDKDGNTPLHLASRFGSLEVVHLLLSKCSSNDMTIAKLNAKEITPLGYALSGRHYHIARHFMKFSLGNPAKRFPDFKQHFPSLSKEQSLDHPVSIFVMGNKKSGKSTLIKSLQVEGYWKRTVGAIFPTTGVEHHSGGIVPSDVSSYGYGRAKFYELASCRETTQEGIFLSLAKPAHSLFVIILSCKDELKEMEASLLFWLSFIHYQFRSISPSIRPSIAVVASFFFYTKVGSLRLDNHTRLRIAYTRVTGKHSELCSYFNFYGKFSMDCRRSESPGMRQLRNVLHRKCRELRPVGGEKNVPSSCYILLNGFQEMEESSDNTPVLKLSDIEYLITNASTVHSQSHSLLSLLPSSTDDLKPLLEILEERKAIITIQHLDPQDPYIIYDEYKLISQIDSTLLKSFHSISLSNDSNPAVMGIEKLLGILSSFPLSREVLLNVLHHFQITEVWFDGEDTKYFLPSILKETQLNTKYFHTWQPDTQYSSGFAWCIVPRPKQIMPFFMPRFLYHMLYELYATATEEGEIDTVCTSHLGLYCKRRSKMEICVTIDSSMVNLCMRCKKGEEVTCLQYRNMFLSAIHQQRKKIQPTLEINEYIISMKAIPIPIRKQSQVMENGRMIEKLRNSIMTRSDDDSVQEDLCLEPYIWCKNLSPVHLMNLLDPTMTNAHVSDDFLQDLKKQMKDNFEVVCSTLDIFSDRSREEFDEERPQYGQIIEVFSTISIFQTASDLYSALKNPSSHEKAIYPQDDVDEAEEVPFSHEELSTPSSSLSHNNSSQFRRVYSADGCSYITACSSTDEITETVSLRSVHSNLPVLNATEDVMSHPTPVSNIKFIGMIEKIQCNVKGGKYECSHHGFAIYIPPGAVNEGTTLTITMGVATVGPFKYPKNTIPVSPILWVQVDFSNGQAVLKEEIEIKLQHAVTGNDGIKHLQLLCCSTLSGTVAFERAHKKSIITPNEGVLHTKLPRKSYCFCISSEICSNSTANMEFCMIKVRPANVDFSNRWKMHFLVTYALPTCVMMVKEQFKHKHRVDEDETRFRFDTSGRRETSISIGFERFPSGKWTLTKETAFDKIMPLDVDFGRTALQHAYPPKFTILINGAMATKNIPAVFQFKGILPANLTHEEPLMVRKYSLQRSVSDKSLHSEQFFSLEGSEAIAPQQPSKVPLTMSKSVPIKPETMGSDQIISRDQSQALTTKKPDSVSVSTRSLGDTEDVRQQTETDHQTQEKLDTLSDSYTQTPRMQRRKIIQISKDESKEKIQDIMQARSRLIIGQMVQTEMRLYLYQRKALSDAEYEKLLSLPPTTANEWLFFMIKKKGTAAFYDFLQVLLDTSRECLAHVEIYDTLTTDLKDNHIIYPPYMKAKKRK